MCRDSSDTRGGAAEVTVSHEDMVTSNCVTWKQEDCISKHCQTLPKCQNDWMPKWLYDKMTVCIKALQLQAGGGGWVWDLSNTATGELFYCIVRWFLGLPVAVANKYSKHQQRKINWDICTTTSLQLQPPVWRCTSYSFIFSRCLQRCIT